MWSAQPTSPPGSSPLARGLRGIPRIWKSASRIIPARAGFTPVGGGAVHGSGDHPRSRGVYKPMSIIPAERGGSSPLARGLQIKNSKRNLGHRIIPARAGFTPRRSATSSRPRDHPRSRGVYSMVRGCPRERAGSSPLARGLRRFRLPGRVFRRIIPARAGFTWVGGVMGERKRDHPRSRGVYDRVWLASRPPPGSSPLARGLRRRPSPGPTRPRIIPARAGFTNIDNS